MSSSLPFFAADMLGLTLFAIEDTLEAAEIRNLKVGPWRVPVQMDARKDIATNKELTFWVQIAGLRLYAIVRETEQFLIVLDAAVVKTCEKETGFKATKLNARIAEIQPAMRTVFKWEQTGGHWKQVQYDGGPEGV